MNESKTPLQSFDPYSFGKRLQNLRKACGVTQEELAVRLCVDRGHIARIERGSRACSIDLLVEITGIGLRIYRSRYRQAGHNLKERRPAQSGGH